jgi:starvation-inducible DNA-binding protein
MELLNRTLVDTTVLMTHAKYAHWNLEGMEFYGLRQPFDEIAGTLEAHGDMVAERVTALGGEALGTAGMAVSNCRLPSMPTDATTGVEYVEILADTLAIHDADLSEAIETAQRYGDEDTADLLDEVSRDVSQHLWFLEAHLQNQPVSGTSTSGSMGVLQPDSQGPSMQGQSSSQQSATQGRMGGQHPSTLHPTTTPVNDEHATTTVSSPQHQLQPPTGPVPGP